LRATAIALCLPAALALASCGGGDSDQSTTSIKPPAITEQASLAEPAPKGASLELKEIFRQFQPPRPDPEVAGSGKAIKEGEATCEGKTPAQVAAAFIESSDLSEDQEEAVSELEDFEANPSPSFPAGQVAALVYERSLPEDELASYGYQGCVYARSLGLKAQLAPQKTEGAKK
jgi:hypothetical protein